MTKSNTITKIRKWAEARRSEKPNDEFEYGMYKDSDFGLRTD